MRADIIRMARECGYWSGQTIEMNDVGIERFYNLAVQHEREMLEVELLKLKQGIAGERTYIQGRWDLIGEFQDILRARGEKQ